MQKLCNAANHKDHSTRLGLVLWSLEKILLDRRPESRDIRLGAAD
ncbi:hypothetical protein [Desulfobaculum senezii]|jgi:hypothetical protein